MWAAAQPGPGLPRTHWAEEAQEEGREVMTAWVAWVVELEMGAGWEGPAAGERRMRGRLWMGRSSLPPR